MPLILIHGLPRQLMGSLPLERLFLTAIPEAVAGVKGMGVTADQVTVFGHPDMITRPEIRLVVVSPGLYIRPARTTKVLEAYGQATYDCLDAFADQLELPVREVEFYTISHQAEVKRSQVGRDLGPFMPSTAPPTHKHPIPNDVHQTWTRKAITR